MTTEEINFEQQSEVPMRVSRKGQVNKSMSEIKPSFLSLYNGRSSYCQIKEESEDELIRLERKNVGFSEEGEEEELKVVILEDHIMSERMINEGDRIICGDSNLRVTTKKKSE